MFNIYFDSIEYSILYVFSAIIIMQGCGYVKYILYFTFRSLKNIRKNTKKEKINMKRTRSKSKKLLLLSLVLAIAMLSIGFTIAASAEDNSDAVWTFTADSIKDPMYVQKYFTSLPRAYEAEIKLPSGSLGSSSPIIANWTQSDTRDAFGFQLSAAGKPTMYYYQNAYDAANSTTVTTKYKADFTYAVPRDQWVRLTVTNEVSNGNSTFKLYVNGALQETINMTGAATFDAVYSQQCMRELSIGNDGKNYFKGEIRNVAVYENAITADEAAKTAKENMQSGNVNLKAYYDATMSGNNKTFFKDQTGHGHDAYSAFFERKEPVKDYDYSFAFIGDTQFLVERDVNNNTTQYASPIFDWIVENKDEKNIQHVFGLGDITDNNSDAEWEYAATLYEKLGNGGVDYSLVSGNHDDYTTPAAKYNKYFGKVSSFVNSIDGYFEEGHIENFYTKFDVGTHKYLVIGLLYGAKDDVLEWANAVVAQNSDREVIVITHSLFNAAGEWALPDTSAQTTTSRKELNNGIDIWDKFISQHSNIIIAAAGHISGDVIKAGKSVGVNGNVVNTFLINPQGFDMATGYDTGMVAMFYFSDDGSSVQVEYVSTTKTLRAQDYDPDSEDILYSEKNNFSFKIREVDENYTYTEYGSMPNEAIEGKTFAVFTGGEFVSAHETWKAATQAAADIFTADKTKAVAILLLKDYTNTSDPLVGLAANYANGSLTIDLGKHTFTRSDTFLNLSSSSDLTNVAHSNIIVKNGTVRSEGGKPIIDNQITNKDYPSEKIWNITFEGVTVGYGESMTTSKGFIYQAWTNSATADDTQLGTKTNIVFNNCTIDLKTNSSGSAVTLFALKDDHSGIDKIDVSVKVSGGTILANADDLKSVTFYTLNTGSDSITFNTDSKGNYTKLKTDSTAVDYSHYAEIFPTASGNRYFVEVSDNGTNSVYELQSLTMTYELLNGSFKSGTISLGTDNENAKYLSAVDYPFALFDQTGKFYNAQSVLLNGAINSAVYHISNSSSKPSGKTAYILMRADYTMTSAEKFDNLSHGRENGIVIDMCGYSIIADSTRSDDIFNATIKQWTGSADDVYTFATRYYVRNGTFKTHTARVLYFKASNGVDLTKKLMSWQFDNVKFELLQGASVNRFFHVANASNTGSSYTSAPVELTLNDCTYDLTKYTSSASSFNIIRCNFGASSAKINGTVKINGGKVLANTLSKVEVIYYVEGNKFSLTYGPGSDGKYFSVVIPKSADASSIIGMTGKKANGTNLVFGKISEASTATYSFLFETPYGYAPTTYENTELYPFFVFKSDGTFVGAYDSWAIDATASALHNSKAEGSVVLLRRNFTYSASQYNNLSQTHSVTIDLNGFELKTTNATLFMAQKKTEYNTKVTVINGTIVVGGQRAVVRMDTGANFSGNYGFEFEFTDVTFKLTENSPVTDNFICWPSYGDADPSQFCNFTFTNCVFDLSNATKAFNIFDVSENRANVKVVINGGEIITSGYDVVVWKDYATTPGSVTANPESSLTFAKDENGAYTTITVPSGTALPIKTVNCGALAFVKTADNGTTATYSLAAYDLSSFTPKTSITLGSELVYNIYIPVTENLKSYTVDGATVSDAEIVTLDDGNEYYHVTVKLPSSVAARNIVLCAVITVGEKDYAGTWTMSIPKYAKKILASDATDVEKDLVCDVLAYIKAAYIYFDATDSDEVSALIDEILNGYAKEFEKLDGTNDTDEGLYGVIIALEEKPAIRFVLPEGKTAENYTFTIGGAALPFTTGTVTLNGVSYTYAEVSLYAYQMTRDITYSDGTVSGSYNFASYYDFVTTDDELKDDAELIALVEKFYNYVASAEAYRASVSK